VIATEHRHLINSEEAPARERYRVNATTAHWRPSRGISHGRFDGGAAQRSIDGVARGSHHGVAEIGRAIQLYGSRSKWLDLDLGPNGCSLALSGGAT